jgi:hypothetical protein
MLKRKANAKARQEDKWFSFAPSVSLRFRREITR